MGFAEIDSVALNWRFVGSHKKYNDERVPTRNLPICFAAGSVNGIWIGLFEFIADAPPRSDRKNPSEYDEYHYRDRYEIEYKFGNIKHDRQVVSRFEKTAPRFLSLIYFVIEFLCLR